MSSLFPLELIDSVLTEVHTHRPTLLSCSLISRPWLTRTRIFLFSSVKVNGRLRDRRFGLFAEFLAESPHIATLIQELVLYGDIPLQPPIITQDGTEKILSGLTNLRKLVLHQVIFKVLHDVPKTPPLRRLQRLAITGTPVYICGEHYTSYDFSGYWGIVGLFTHIKDIYIADLLTSLPKEETLPIQQTFKIDTEIEEFTIGSHAHTAAIVNSFRKFTHRRNFRALEVSIHDDHDLTEFGELLTESSARVRHVGISIADGAPIFSEEVNIDIWGSFYAPGFTFLTSFMLDLQVYSPITMDIAVSMLRSLEKCPRLSTILQHLKIQLLLPDHTPDAVSQISDFNWETLAQWIIQRRSIKKVEIVICDWFDTFKGPRPDEVRAIRRALPVLDEQGILDVHAHHKLSMT